MACSLEHVKTNMDASRVELIRNLRAGMRVLVPVDHGHGAGVGAQSRSKVTHRHAVSPEVVVAGRVKFAWPRIRQEFWRHGAFCKGPKLRKKLRLLFALGALESLLKLCFPGPPSLAERSFHSLPIHSLGVRAKCARAHQNDPGTGSARSGQKGQHRTPRVPHPDRITRSFGTKRRDGELYSGRAIFRPWLKVFVDLIERGQVVRQTPQRALGAGAAVNEHDGTAFAQDSGRHRIS